MNSTTRKVRVYIATTQGPVEIQRITREESGVPSCFCQNGYDGKLPISRDYDLFVQKSGGCIAKRIGHDSFRVDLSDNVHQGESWQLALVIAHDLENLGMLAVQNESADLIVWATGVYKSQDDRVSERTEIKKIGGLNKKLAQSESLFREQDSAGTPVIVFYPGCQDEEIETASFPSHIRLLGVDLYSQISEELGLSVIDQAAVSSQDTVKLQPPVNNDNEQIVSSTGSSEIVESAVPGEFIGQEGERVNRQRLLRASSMTIAVTLVLTLLVFLILMNKPAWNNPEISRQEVPVASATEQASVQSSGQLTEAADPAGLQWESLQLTVVEQRSSAGGCNADTVQTNIPLPPQEGRIDGINLEKLCELVFTHPMPVAESEIDAVAYTNDGAIFINLEQRRQGNLLQWIVPRPVQQNRDRSYTLWLIEGFASGTVSGLLREAFADNAGFDRTEIQELLQARGARNLIYLEQTLTLDW